MRLSTFLVSVLASSFSVAAMGGVLHFDDLGQSSGGTLMPATYSGLHWGNSSWHFMTAATGNNFLALSTPSTLVRSENLSDFVFDGADFWSRRGADASGDFYFFLYRDGEVVYDGFEDPDGRQIFDGTPRLFSPNFTGLIDAFAIAFDNDDHDHLAMDNLRVTSIPAPGGCVLGLGVAILGLRRPRRS